MRPALIFDFDGTLAPTEAAVHAAWEAFFRERGHELSVARWSTAIGGVEGETRYDPWAEAEQLGFGARSVVEPLVRRLLDARLQGLEAAPGALALLESAAAAGLPLGVASGSSSGWVLRHLERLGLQGFFSTVRTRDHGPAKPSPALYRMALEDLGADAASSWAIEDSGPGVAAARAAGMRVLAVPHALTATHEFSGAQMVVASLQEVTLLRLGLAAG
ncbi:MAG: HAD family hydrolase [Planctomycetaceae bacterium]